MTLAPGTGEGVSPRRKPPWSDWEVDFEAHARRRMLERGLTELDVRHMLEHARRYHRSRYPGHWIVLAGLRGVRWEIVVRPQAEHDLVEVVTVMERKASR